MLVDAVIFWPATQAWSEIKDRIDAIPAGNGAIVLMEAGTYTMDVAADLDRVIFIGMVESPTAFGGVPTTITMVSPFTLLGKSLYLVNVVALTRTTILDGAGTFRLNLMGSSGLTPDYTQPSMPPSIKLGASGVMNVSTSQYSEFGGGNDYTVEMDDGAVINFLLTAAGIVGDKAATLKSGATAAAVTLAVDSSCVVAGVNGAFGTAFDTGIDSTTDVSKNGNAFFGPYAPTTSSDWDSPVPDNVGAALDQVAARLRAGSL